MSARNSMKIQMDLLLGYSVGVFAHGRAAAVADEIADEFERRETSATVAVPWSSDEPVLISVHCAFGKEAELRTVVRELCAANNLELRPPTRLDERVEYGWISIDYGPIAIRLLPDNKTCRRVKIGERQMAVPIYEIVCDEPNPPEGIPQAATTEGESQ